jgi:DNA polymerase-3 subunit delta
LPVIVLAGEEEYLIAQRVKSLKKELVDPQFETFNFARIENPDLRQAVDAAATVPFGPGNRMVLLDRCALFTKKKSASASEETSSKSSKLIDDFEAAMNSVSPNTYLVFACIANFDKTLKPSKAIEKVAKFEKFEKAKYLNRETEGSFLSFCSREAHRWDAYIDEDACFYLRESTEADLRLIAKEIEKAATYILPQKTIKLEHVELLSPHYSEIFDLMSHWAARDGNSVLGQLNELRAKQVSPHMVLAIMQTQLKNWLTYKTEYEKAKAQSGGRNVSLDTVASRLQPNPRMQFIVVNDLKKIKDLPLDYLISKKQELTELEHKVKTGQLPDSHVLELFFTR